MDLLTAYLESKEAQESWDKITDTVERAMDPFIPGKIEFWYDDTLLMPDVLTITMRIENLGQAGLRFDKAALYSSYMSPLDMVLLEFYDKIRNRPALPIDNPNIILGEE